MLNMGIKGIKEPRKLVTFPQSQPEPRMEKVTKSVASDLPLASRIRGSIYGVAVVDALGGPVEFLRRGTFPKIESFIANTNFKLPPGCWTDDTSMTLCLATSLIKQHGQFILKDQIDLYIDWWENGYLSSIGKCFDVGMATRKALTLWKSFFSKNAELETMRADESETIMQKGTEFVNRTMNVQQFCGNGSLMRVAPIALVYHDHVPTAVLHAAQSSIVTHPYITNTEACAVYTLLLCGVLHGKPKSILVQDLSEYPFEDSTLRARFTGRKDLTAWLETPENLIKSSGYVVYTLEAALWAFFTTDTFRDGAIKVVNLGDDADTVGAVYGGLAGAFYGFESIPLEWRTGLVKKELVEQVADGLVELGCHKRL